MKNGQVDPEQNGRPPTCKQVEHLADTDRSFRDSNVETDALSQREVFAPVDRVCLAAHVLLPRIRTTLAAAAGFLLAAEGATDLGARGADVDVGDAAVAASGAPECERLP